MTVRKAVYAASLDPITNGHLNVIERVAPLYDDLVVVVAVDYRKTYTFTPEERMAMAKYAIAHLPNVKVDVVTNRYVVKYASSIGAKTIIRGVRNFKDLEDEQTLAEENRRICSDVETIWIPCLPELMHVSSSMVKGHVGVDPGWEVEVARSVPTAVVYELKKKYILGKARKHWMTLMAEVGNPSGHERIFDSLVSRYSEPKRAYHTLEHVVSMLDEFEEVKGFAINPTAVKFAIWYHDSIYDPESKDHHVIASNEERSANRAELDMVELGLPEELISLVSGDCRDGLIMATTHTKQVSDTDEQILVDLDLAILGKPETEFAMYEAEIRDEYDFVSLTDFRVGRSKILQTFLDRPSIYSTEFFRAKYEATARENLKRSILKLTK